MLDPAANTSETQRADPYPESMLMDKVTASCIVPPSFDTGRSGPIQGSDTGGNGRYEGRAGGETP